MQWSGIVVAMVMHGDAKRPKLIKAYDVVTRGNTLLPVTRKQSRRNSALYNRRTANTATTAVLLAKHEILGASPNNCCFKWDQTKANHATTHQLVKLFHSTWI